MILFIERFIPNKLKPLYFKYKSVIWYLVFGAITTVINIFTYWLCYSIFNISNKPSNIIAWILTVTVAYLTNRKAVFDSNAATVIDIVREIIMFFACRLATGLLDLVIMSFAVEYMEWNSLLWKIISNIIVIVTNYVASKLVIFKHK